MKALCKECIRYEAEGNDAICELKIWPKVTLSRSKIYNAMMFECIEHERTSLVSFEELNPFQDS